MIFRSVRILALSTWWLSWGFIRPALLFMAHMAVAAEGPTYRGHFKTSSVCIVHLVQAAIDCHVPGSFRATHSIVPWLVD